MKEYTESYRASLEPGQPFKTCANCHMPISCQRLTQGKLLSLIHPPRIVHDHSFNVWTPVVTQGAVEVTQLGVNATKDSQLTVF